MTETFIKIGKIIRHDAVGRSEYHPTLQRRNITTKSGIVDKKKLAVYFTVDMDNATVDMIQHDTVLKNIDVIKYATSAAVACPPYLVGSFDIKLKPNAYEKELSFASFEKIINDYPAILTPDSFIYKYRKIIGDNHDHITSYIRECVEQHMSLYDFKTSKQRSEVTLILVATVIVNGKLYNCQDIPQVLDEMDEMYTSASSAGGDVYYFYNSCLGMFNYGKYTDGNNATKPESSIPSCTKDELLNLWYSKNMYDETHYKLNKFGISVYPNYPNLTYGELKRLADKSSRNIFDFSVFINHIKNEFIKNKYETGNLDDGEIDLIPMNLTFDIYYRDSSGRTTQNILHFSSVRYAKFVQIHNKLTKAYHEIYDEPTMNTGFLEMGYKNLFTNKFGEYDLYEKTIMHAHQNIFKNIYAVSPMSIDCLLERIQYQIRNGETSVNPKYKKQADGSHGYNTSATKSATQNWKDSFTFYKFLMHMINPNFSTSLVSDPSYRLGRAVAELEGKHSWDETSNLHKTINLFAGNIKRNIRTTENVRDYISDLQMRMKRNGYTPYRTEDLDNLHLMDEKYFNKSNFYCGYFDKKFTYTPRTKSQEPNNESNQ